MAGLEVGSDVVGSDDAAFLDDIEIVDELVVDVSLVFDFLADE